jgi:hypothetical protein
MEYVDAALKSGLQVGEFAVRLSFSCRNRLLTGVTRRNRLISTISDDSIFQVWKR